MLIYEAYNTKNGKSYIGLTIHTLEFTRMIDIAILLGLTINAYLCWRTFQDMDQLEEVILHMVVELGEKGILKVEVHEDD